MSDFATYSLGVVLRETGINPDTLRAWERRYDLPQPSRSEGGQRLYTERDIALIKWLLERTNEGMRIGCAVKLWKSKIAAGEDPLLQHSAAPTEIDEGSPFVDFQKKWIAACIDFDEATAEAVTDEAFARFTPETAFTEIFIPAIREVGELWYRGEASVQQEHFASNLVTRRLGAIISSIPRPTRPEKVIIGCPPNEEHTIALQLTSLYLRRRGFNVIDLGANVPLAQFVETAEKIKPTLVILAAQQLISAATLAETIQTLDEQNITTAYAGRIFSTTPALRERVYGHFLGETLNEGIQNAEFVLNKKIVPIIIKQTRNPLENMLKSFDFYRFTVHVHLITDLVQFFPYGISIQAFQRINRFLSANILAAGKLGNLDFLKPELDWAQTLIENHSQTLVPMTQYLELYAEAAQRAMGANAAPLAEWLMDFVANQNQIKL